jgi:hypothetical protein
MGLDPGLWLVRVTLDEMSGLTVVEIAEDNSVRALGPGRGVYLFPSRHGIADFLASGEWHALHGRLGDYDVLDEEPEFAADFVLLRDSDDLDDQVAALIWMQCLLIVDACGVVDPPTVEHAAAQVAALTKLRPEFERPGYVDQDYWMDRDVRPVELRLPSGIGVTLAAPEEFWLPEPEAQPFLGDLHQVVLFRDPVDLLAYVRDDGTDEMRRASWWPVDPPTCEPQLAVDVWKADPEYSTSDAMDYLRGLAMVLTDRKWEIGYGRSSGRRLRKEQAWVVDVLLEVDRKVTWR